jgi:hypothetical protein
VSVLYGSSRTQNVLGRDKKPLRRLRFSQRCTRGAWRISTAADDVLDVRYAKSAGVAEGPVINEFFGPQGTHGDEFISRKQVVIAIDGQGTAPTQPMIPDYCAYNDLPRPTVAAQAVQGNLGAVFMLANQAVIDFGTETLFLPGRKIPLRKCKQ